MPDVDPLVLELRVEAQRARQELRDYASAAERRFEQMEARMRRSTEEIGASFRSLAGTLATAFSVQQVQQLADGYTRFTNQLKVAGLEGENLARGQEELFQIAQKYGVELEAVGTLYSRAAQSSVELNASQGDLLAVTEAVSASLKISGTSATEARGALLQLSQALGSPRIQAEEFNSLLDTMQPLLREVAKRIEGTGGTIGGLTRKIKDLKSEGVSNVQLFEAVKASLADLQETAATTNLTIGNSLTALNNALGKYVGETDASLSATERLSSAIITLSENLDTIIPILATILGFIGVKYVAALATAIARSAGLAAVSLGLAASLNGVGAAASMAGARLLALSGGPLAAVIALGAGLAYIASEMDDGGTASGQYATQLGQLKKAQDAATDAAQKLATATGQARRETIANAKALRQETIQYLENAKAALIAARAKAQEAAIQKQKALNESDARTTTGAAQALAAGGGQFGIPINPGSLVANRVNNQAQTDLNAARQAVKGYEDVIADLDRTINGTPQVVIPGDADKKKDRKGRGSADRSAEIAAQVEDEIRQMTAERLRAVADQTNSAMDRAAAEYTALIADRAAFDDQIALDKDLTPVQREQLKNARDALDAVRKRALFLQYSADLAQEQFERESAANALEQEVVSARGRVKDRTASQRKMTDLRLIDLEFSQREDEATREYNDATKRGDQVAADIAESKLARIALLKELAQEEAALRNQSPLEAYLDSVPQTAEELNEHFESIAVNGLQSLNDGLTDAIVNSKSLGDVFKNVAKQIIADLIRIAIQQTIVNSLFKSSGDSGGGGLFGSIVSGVGAIFGGSAGRASGGYVAPGQTVRVNEHRGGSEYFTAGSKGANVIPMGQVNAMAARSTANAGGVVRIVVEEGPNFLSTIRAEAEGVSLEVTRAAAGPISDLGAQKALKAANRPTM